MEIITVAEASELRNVMPSTIRFWIRRGWITSARKSGATWLMERAEVMAFEPPKPGPQPKEEGK